MRLQPNRNYVSNDDIQIPPELARRLVEHFHPTGLILEPCAGDGNFLRALRAHVRSTNSRLRSPKTALRSDARSLNSQPLTLNSARRSHVAWCEAKRGSNFLAWDRPVDWIITNPPWSEIRSFLQHTLRLADHVVFLFTINHLWTRARLRDLKTAGFGLREIVMMDTPANFPPMGFQLGAVHLSRGWTGPVTLTDWNERDPVGPVEGRAAGVHGWRSASAPSDNASLTTRNVRPSTVHRARPAQLPTIRSAAGTDADLAKLHALNRHLDALLAKVVKPRGTV